MCLFCVVSYFVTNACLLLLCLIHFFITRPRDWLGRTSPKWPVWCHSVKQFAWDKGARVAWLLTVLTVNRPVTGLYQSLTAGWRVSRQDVDEAVNNVCEELAPIEIDITNFILSSCRLTHHMLDVGALRHSLQLPDSVSRSPSTVMSSCDEEQSAEPSSSKVERFAWHVAASM